MKRRAMLTLFGTTAVGGAGCTRLGRREFRLHFVRIRNASPNRVDVGIRVRRSGEIVFESEYENIPSFREREYDEDNPETDYADVLNVRLIESEWEDEPAMFDLEYRLSDGESWSEADFEEPETEHTGIEMTLLGGFGGTSATFQALEFEHEGEVEYLLGKADKPE